MIDDIQVQNDCFGLLMSAPALAAVNIISERKLLVQSALAIDTIWSTVRNGRSGCGVLCEMVTVNVIGKNGPFPALLLTVPFVCFQNGDAAFAPETGCGIYAEQLASLVMDILGGQEIRGIGTLYLEAKAREPAREYEFINAQRVTFYLKTQQTNQTLHCLPVSLAYLSGYATLTCATADAEIYFTTDGSTPVHSRAIDPITDLSVNPASQFYTAPFAVTSGQRIRAVAYAEGYNASLIINELIP